MNTNYQINKGNQNLPYLNKEKVGQKFDSFSNSVINKAKLLKFGNNNINNNVSQTFNSNKNNNNSNPKKLKLGNPDYKLSNTVIPKKKRIITKNKSFGMGYERNSEAKEIENLFYRLQSYIPHYESNLDQDEACKSFGLNQNKNSNNSKKFK